MHIFNSISINSKTLKVVLFSLSLIILQQQLAASSGNYPLNTFDYGEVRLKAGRQLKQLEEDLEFYLSIPNDNILRGFRNRAGITAYGTGMGGFYEQDVFHVFGQLLAGYSRLYGATGDERCFEKLNALIDGWAETIEPDGYFYFSRNPNAPHYIFEKTLGGLVDAYIFTGNRTALEAMGRITDWAIKNLDRETIYGYNMGSGNTEWYTLSENLFRAYIITGEEKYLKFAEHWEYPEFWNLIRTGGDPFSKKSFYHAYSHLNTFSGAAAAYRVKNDPVYLDIIMAAYDYFRNNQCLVTGGYGVMERLREPGGIRELLKEADHSFEVACCSWAGFKMCKSLIEFTGEARYGDWIEELMINCIGSTIPMLHDGRQHHYACYNPKGGSKENFPVGWYCCTGTRPQAIADYHNLIWYHDTENLYMSLFVPSSLQWKGMTVTQSTRFPEENKTIVNFEGGKPVQFRFAFRKPGWMPSAAEVKLNGKKITPLLEGGWYYIDKKWKSGDNIEITLPMEMGVSLLPDGKPNPAALKYGPVAMAFKVPEGDCPIEVLTAPKTRVTGDMLTFHVEGYPEILLRPYYLFGEGERYFLYLDPERREQIPEESINRIGEWKHGGNIGWFADIAGASLEVPFDGSHIRWKGYKDWNGGCASVYIDNEFIEKVDMWDVTGTPFSWEKEGLSPGKHSLRIVLDEPVAETNGRNMTYNSFEVVK